MSNNIYLKKGLDLPISGEAAQSTKKVIVPDVVAVKPTDFRGLVPKLLVREGDKVLAGTPVLADKMSQNILFASPVSGTVAEVVRGEKRKLLEVRIKADAEQEYVDFGVKNVADLSAEQIKEALLAAGLWPAINQRPYGIVANPEVKPKAIFVSAFNTAPLAADAEYALAEDYEHIQTAIDALGKLTDGGVHLSLNSANYSGTPFHKLANVIQHTFTGKHPVGNVGVQISNISPIRKGETVWTVSLVMLAAIGKLFNTGKYDLRRKIAVTGPKAIDPAYVVGYPGIAVKDVAEFYNASENLRFVSGDVLSGTTAIAYTDGDQTAAARILGKYSEKYNGEKFTLKAGFVDGEIYDAKGVVALSKIPSKEVLLAQLLGSLQAPMQNLAATLQALVDKKNSEEAA
jgi:Na+-transporting NADH:ubiquinone oxidoreductase subunit A